MQCPAKMDFFLRISSLCAPKSITVYLQSTSTVAILKQKVVQTSNFSYISGEWKNCVFVMPVLILFIIYQMYMSSAVYFMKICYISYMTKYVVLVHTFRKFNVRQCF